jgi:hypothetical protein
MTITPTTLTRVAGIAAIGAGLLFVGVQIKHPHLDATSIGSTEVVVRNVLKVFMAVFGLIGITGMYLNQVRRNGVVGLIGYVLLGTGYLLIMSNVLAAAFVMPTIADINPAYVSDVLAATKSQPVTGDIGLLRTVLHIQDFAYLAGGLVFGIALYRARVLARWAAVLLAVGGVVTIVLSLLPDAFYRLLAFPNGIAMIGLGYSLWRVARTTQSITARVPAGVE